jgi:tetratricopeptide (TPR) repeat protein
MAEYNKSSLSTNDLAKKTLVFIARFLAKKFKHVYYSARESIGDHKRVIVVAQVEQACQSLQETRDEFEDALERFKSLVCVNETTLDHRYNLLNRQYQFCRAKSDAVSDRIRAIEEVSEALFVEWERELDEYSNRSLRMRSSQQLKTARQNYARLIKSMHRAESKIQPVLSAFKDQVLYLKHNLNAQAIAALRHEFIEIGIDISQLIYAMEQTIAEASQFVSLLVEQKALPRP